MKKWFAPLASPPKRKSLPGWSMQRWVLLNDEN
jgi:hypothetical protein